MLHVKYRPKTFDEMIGNKGVIKNLKKQLASPDKPRSLLFTGPSGVGKTTLANVIGEELKRVGSRCWIQKINSANYRGIEYIRDFVNNLDVYDLVYKIKVFILDECHQITNDAQQVLYEAIEEPPKDFYFIFCTTDPEKLIEPFKNRCLWYKLKPASDEEIRNLLKSVVEKESISITEEKIEALVIASKGIPRDALMELRKARFTESFDETENLIYRK